MREKSSTQRAEAPDPTTSLKGRPARTYRFEPRAGVRKAVRSLFPNSTIGILGQISAALSLLALFRNAITLGLSSAFSIILSVYIRAVDLTIGRFDPVIQKLIHSMNMVFSVHITFHEGWRYIFVVLQILFVRDAQTAYHDDRYTLAAIRLVTGTLISVVCSMLVFSSTPDNDLYANIWFCLIPVFGLLIYDLIMYAFSATLFFDQVGVGETTENIERQSFLIVGIKRSLFRFFIVALPSMAVFLIPTIRQSRFPDGGVVAIIVGVIVNSLYWLLKGSYYAASQAKEGKRFRAVFLASEAGRFGLSISGVLFWMLVFCVLNAGSRLVGL